MTDTFNPKPLTGVFENEWEFEGRDTFDGIEFEGYGDPNEPAERFPSLNDVCADNIDSMFKVVNVKGKACILYWGRSALDSNWRVAEFWNKESFSLALANKFVTYDRTVTDEDGNETTKKAKKPLAKMWLEGNRKTYDGVVFKANRADVRPDEINLWRTYGVKEFEPGDWSLLQQHIFEVVANGNREHFDYIIRWCAWAVQNPTEVAEVALVLYSEKEGTGKGTLGHALRKLFGPHGVHISRYEDLTGKFNAHLAQCAFLFIDEALWPGYKDSEGIIKALITEQTLNIESKGVNKLQMPNALSCLFCSNKRWVVPAGEDARRFAVFEVSDHRKGNYAYFNAIRRQLYEQGGLGRMLYDLKRLDLTGWDIRRFPQTEALAIQKMETAESWQKWLADILNEGVLPRARDGNDRHLAANKARGSVLLEHARKQRGLERISSQSLTDHIKALGAERGPRSRGSVWEFPALPKVRAKWHAEYAWWAPFDPDVTEWVDESPDDDSQEAE